MKAKWYGGKQIWMMIYTAIVFLIAGSIVGGNNNTVFPAFAALRDWNINAINVVSGVSAMLVGIGVLVFSPMIRKLGARIVMTITMLVSAGILVVFSYTKSLPIFLVCILLIGFISGAYDKGGAMVLTANWWPTKKGVVFGFTTMGYVAMSAVYVPTMPRLFARFGVSNGMIVIAVIVAIVGILTAIFVRNTPEEAGTYPDGDPGFHTGVGSEIDKAMREYKSPYTIKKLMSSKNNWFIAIGSFLIYMAAMNFVASTIPNLIGFGYDPGFCTKVFAIAGIIAFGGSFMFGVLDQKIGTRKAYVFLFVFVIVGFVLALFMARSAVFVWATALVLFIAQGAIGNVVPSYVTTIYGRWDYPAAWRFIGTIFVIGCGFGIMMTGFFHNPYAMYGFDLAALIVAMILIMCSKDTFIGKAD